MPLNKTIKALTFLQTPIAVVGGLVGAWLFTEIPGIHVFASQDTTTKAVTSAIAFIVSGVITWGAHQRFINTLVELVTTASPTVLAVVHEFTPFVAVVSAWIATWLFSNIPGIHVFASSDGIARGLAAIIVFVTTALLAAYANHNLNDHIVAHNRALHKGIRG